MLSSSRRTFVAQTFECFFLLLIPALGHGQAPGKSNSKPSDDAAARSAIEKKVKSIVVEQLGVKESEVTLKARFVEDLGADSLDVVELVMAFEEAFDIEIPDEDAEKMRTVGDAVDYICKHAKARK